MRVLDPTVFCLDVVNRALIGYVGVITDKHTQYYNKSMELNTSKYMKVWEMHDVFAVPRIEMENRSSMKARHTLCP